MSLNLPIAGAASTDLQDSVHKTWLETAAGHGVDLADFTPASPLEERCRWARAQGLDIGVVLSRYSTDLQQSTSAQVSETVRFAAANKIYVPPELVCVDEGVSGQKVRRDGLDRVKLILRARLAHVMLVYKMSRLFRAAYKGYQFVKEEVVDEGLRAISTSQGIDTRDAERWKFLTCLHGLMDDMLLTAIADHVRSGLAHLFRSGFVTGALTVGYRAVEVPGAPPTKLGKPRRMPGVDEEAAVLIRQHFTWIGEGLSLREGWRRWIHAGGPSDPRSVLKRMSPQAYRRMLSNPRYLGRWAFGRLRNAWNGKRDYTRQVAQPEAEVRILQSEELRIISNELFFAVQERLLKAKSGPRGPSRRKDARLCDRVTGCFLCAACSTPQEPVRLYQAGPKGSGMKCKRDGFCQRPTTVHRETAVRAVCAALQSALRDDAAMVEKAILAAQAMNAGGDEDLHRQLTVAVRNATKASRRYEDLMELMGEGSEEDRSLLKAEVRKALSERASTLAEQARLRSVLQKSASPLTAEQVQASLANLKDLLEKGASGELGQDMVHKAVEAFRLLVGGCVLVHTESRPGRKRVNVSATFTPQTLAATKHLLDDHRPGDMAPAAEVRVWLREPPLRDRLAGRVHELMDGEGHSYRDVAKILQAEGHRMNSGVVWQIYRRYYEMTGQPVPEPRYNNGNPRAARRADPSQ
jgi:site-specific DNA recombinase